MNRFGGQGIDVRCLVEIASGASQICPTHVIHEEDNDVFRVSKEWGGGESEGENERAYEHGRKAAGPLVGNADGEVEAAAPQ